MYRELSVEQQTIWEARPPNGPRYPAKGPGPNVHQIKRTRIEITTDCGSTHGGYLDGHHAARSRIVRAYADELEYEILAVQSNVARQPDTPMTDRISILLTGNRAK